MVFLVELLELGVLPLGDPSVTGDVDDEEHLGFVLELSEAYGLAVDVGLL